MAQEKKKVGRPPTPIDWETFDKLCALQCTPRELSDYFNCKAETIEARVLAEKGMPFSEYFEQKRVPGKISLRRRQFEVAMTGNVGMLIWLGKQWLGQTEKVQAIETDEKVITLSYKPVKVEVQREN